MSFVIFVSNGLTPFWNEKFEFLMLNPELALLICGTT